MTRNMSRKQIAGELEVWGEGKISVAGIRGPGQNRKPQYQETGGSSPGSHGGESPKGSEQGKYS